MVVLLLSDVVVVVVVLLLPEESDIHPQGHVFKLPSKSYCQGDLQSTGTRRIMMCAHPGQ